MARSNFFAVFLLNVYLCQKIIRIDGHYKAFYKPKDGNLTKEDLLTLKLQNVSFKLCKIASEARGKARIYFLVSALTSMYAGSTPAGEMWGCQSLGGFERYLESVTTHLSRGQPKSNPK